MSGFERVGDAGTEDEGEVWDCGCGCDRCCCCCCWSPPRPGVWRLAVSMVDGRAVIAAIAAYVVGTYTAGWIGDIKGAGALQLGRWLLLQVTACRITGLQGPGQQQTAVVGSTAAPSGPSKMSRSTSTRAAAYTLGTPTSVSVRRDPSVNRLSSRHCLLTCHHSKASLFFVLSLLGLCRRIPSVGGWPSTWVSCGKAGFRCGMRAQRRRTMRLFVWQKPGLLSPSLWSICWFVAFAQAAKGRWQSERRRRGRWRDS